MIKLISATGEVRKGAIIYSVAAVSIAIAVAFAASTLHRETLKECILSEMRGQPDRMIGIAKATCEERHPDLVGKESLH